jgi:monovalent cation:H+ antiporter-2, CPA2 family
MPHDTALIGTIATGIGLAFLLGMLAQRLRLPPLVGYLAAGIVAGPFTATGINADGALAAQLAEIGVILLMFGVGIHFSIDQLLAVRRIAVPGAIVQITVATALGAAMAHWWGWSWGSAVVFGLSLSVASTVVLLRAMEERGALDTSDGRIAVGWLIVEDLAMVLALVLLPALALPLGGSPTGLAATAAQGNVWVAVGITIAKVVAFLALMLVVGRRVVPWLLERTARTGSRELFTLAVLAVALGVAVGAAALFGVSFALGAFFAGVVISESDLSHQAASDALPLQDAFAVLFFFSVGMLFDPSIVIEQPFRLLGVILVIIVGKSLAAFAIVLAFRHPIHRALIVSASLAQIGEFSFILAALGVSLGLLPVEAQSLILAGALFSITLNPVAFSIAGPIERWVRARPELQDRLERVDEHDPLRFFPDAEHDGPDGHAVLVGHGRVGSVVAYALSQAEIPFVVIEQDRGVVDSLRRLGVPAIYGDATRQAVREQAHIKTARLLIITTPDPYQARSIVVAARRDCPDLQTVVRTHSQAERDFLRQLDVGRVFMGERELAYGMAHYSLMAMGRTDDAADEAVLELRAID